MRPVTVVLFLLVFQATHAQQTNDPPDNFKQTYLSELKTLGKRFSENFYPRYDQIYSLPEATFVAKIDSVRKNFNTLLDGYQRKLATAYIREQRLEIKYYFDKLLIDYPSNHAIYVSQSSPLRSSIPAKLKTNLVDFNQPELLANADFTNYVRAFLAFQLDLELKKKTYFQPDNGHLNAIWQLIPRFISDPKCRVFWQSEYLYNHIDNNGIKNIESIYRRFKTTCTDTLYLNKVRAAYQADSANRQGHVIRPYKTIGSLKLDVHLFLPDTVTNKNKKPVIVFFHGGSWSEGKPDWFFQECREYAKKGWVACAVEYRTYSRHGTLPFAAVMDAKSAVRWLRKQANALHIDLNKIVASGNSAGGHLVLCTALADQWNEKTDDLTINAVPNTLLINAGIYDLTDKNTAWVRRDLPDKDLIKQISPNHLAKKNLPPTMILHGTDDRNAPYATAKLFAAEMTKAGTKTLQFHPLPGAGHFIWFDPNYASDVSKIRSDFLKKLGY